MTARFAECDWRIADALLVWFWCRCDADSALVCRSQKKNPLASALPMQMSGAYNTHS
jgi:hypothetical protein